MQKFYACDFLKNYECRKTSCQRSCYATTKLKFARRNIKGEPIACKMLVDDAEISPES